MREGLNEASDASGGYGIWFLADAPSSVFSFLGEQFYLSASMPNSIKTGPCVITRGR